MTGMRPVHPDELICKEIMTPFSIRHACSGKSRRKADRARDITCSSMINESTDERVLFGLSKT
jgi:hypothetical protein